MRCNGIPRFALCMICCWPALTWCQSPSLNGYIRDRFDGTPINGAQVVIAGQTVGISGPDGRYVVDIQRTTTISVVYKQIEYGDLSQQVILGKGQTRHDVALIKSTISNIYWKAAAQSVQNQALLQQGDQMQIYLKAWQDIDASGLSPEAKATAARQFSSIIPTQANVPISLKAYRDSDPTAISNTTAGIKQVLSGSATLPTISTQVPGSVAADIAAKQVTEFENTSGKTVQTKFFTDFNQKFGADAGVRLKDKIGQIKTTTQQISPN